MARLNVAAAGNAEENINLINARFQAEALRRIRGVDCGVLDNSFYSSSESTGLTRDANANFMWKLTASNVQNITVGRGMATAYGFDIQSEADVSFTATAPSSGTKYLFIYLEWDLANPEEAVGSIKIHDNGSSASWTPPSQNNLITNPIGKYQMPLYRLAVNTSGTVTGTQTWTTLGVKTIGNPLRADYATRANDSDRADYPSGDTSGKTIKQLFAGVNQRLDELGFKQGTIGGGASGTLTKLGNYVIGTLTFSAGLNFSASIPEGFRPYVQHSTNFCLRGYDTTGRVYFYTSATLYFNTNGTVTASSTSGFDDTKTVMFGWDTTSGQYGQ